MARAKVAIHLFFQILNIDIKFYRLTDLLRLITTLLKRALKGI